MYTLKGIFPEPKKDQKKNFIKENMKQLKYLGKNKQPNNASTGSLLVPVKSSPSNKSGKVTLNVKKSSTMPRNKRLPEHRIKKGDMAEFLKRKEQRQTKQVAEDSFEDQVSSTESSGRLRDMGCQTVEMSLAKKLAESTKLTVLYPRKEEEASGDSSRQPASLKEPHAPLSHRAGDELLDSERNRSRLNTILERKDKNNTKDPYLPAGYQKGVLPKYLKERKEQGLKDAEGVVSNDSDAICPPGHVTLPDNERKETLRMLRNSFAELVSELNKMPVKTDTLRMRNRKIELEKQLSKLEEGIKVFSRPKVFVKIGE